MFEYYKAREEAFRKRFKVLDDLMALTMLKNGQELWSAHYAEDSIDDGEDDFYFTTVTLDDLEGYTDEEIMAYGPFARE